MLLFSPFSVPFVFVKVEGFCRVVAMFVFCMLPGLSSPLPTTPTKSFGPSQLALLPLF